jgi:hypothetical protein
MQLIYMQNKHCLSAITWPLVSPTTQSNCLHVHLGHDAICEGLGRGEVHRPVVFQAFRRDAISHQLKSAFGKWDFTSPMANCTAPLAMLFMRSCICPGPPSAGSLCPPGTRHLPRSKGDNTESILPVTWCIIDFCTARRDSTSATRKTTRSNFNSSQGRDLTKN